MGRDGERPKTPQSLFSAVAPRYDAINRALSLGRDAVWRRRAAERLGVPADAEVLDVATGTGALAVAVAERLGAGGRVVGCDINEDMLAIARERVARARSHAAIELLVADATALPFAAGRFAAVTLGFAIDDTSDRRQCARELFRVLAPGGRVVILELALPDHRLVRSLYRGYLGLMPAAARLLGDTGAPYGHLRREILGYRGRAAVPELLREVGFVGHTREDAAAGVVSIHVADKPKTDTPIT